jgi:hypothetical protein
MNAMLTSSCFAQTHSLHSPVAPSLPRATFLHMMLMCLCPSQAQDSTLTATMSKFRGRLVGIETLILPVVLLFTCGIWSFSLREESGNVRTES